MEKELEKRMYFLVMYNISKIQQAIQSGHAQMEYALKYWEDENFQDWATNYKTWIILNGGTSNHSDKWDIVGTMEESLIELKEARIKHASFNETDLNDSLSAIAFLVDERVFNKEDYPDLQDFISDKIERQIFLELVLESREGVSDFRTVVKTKYPKEYGEWLDLIGGKQNAFLKDFLKNFRLA